MSRNQILALSAVVVLLLVGVIAYRSVSPPQVAPPRPITAETPVEKGPKDGWTEASLTGMADGRQVAVVKPGSGPNPVKGQVVEVHYTAWLHETKRRFDSSHDRKRPVRFVLGQKTPLEGWTATLMEMTAGEIRQVHVPPDLAYGSHGKPPTIPGDATLVYELELLEIEDARTVPDAPPTAEATQELEGLKFAVLDAGTGDKPTAGKKAHIHFTIWLEDGTLVDSSLKRNQPAVITVGKHQVMKGLERAVADMATGERRKLVVPPDLGAGEKGAGPIPPNSTLIFEVELLRIE